MAENSENHCYFVQTAVHNQTFSIYKDMKQRKGANPPH